MTAPAQPNPPEHGQILVYQAEDGQVKIDVRLENETAWLTQAQMARLFQTTIPNVNMHLRNVFAEGELQPPATIKEFLIVRQEGNRQVSRAAEHYNFESNSPLISIGCESRDHFFNVFLAFFRGCLTHQTSTGPLGTGMACRSATVGSRMKDATIGGGR